MLSQQRNKSRSSSKAKQQDTSKESYEAAQVEKEILAPFITNLEDNVYAITNLPEEFVAVLFAWVSRSPKSFKENLLSSLKDKDGVIDLDQMPRTSFEQLSEKARAFHEKWVVGYGHSSVAEHAVAHVGIEKVSRLASAELELSNEFYSITEYSQRYQKPKRGDWYNPFPRFVSHNGPTRDMKENPAWHEYEAFMNECFDVFEKLIEGVYTHLQNEFLVKHGRLPEKHEDAALEKLAFEDARYALPLSMYTQLGMTANGRAWRDGISKLLSTSDYPEVIELAEKIKREVSKVLPTLLKHAEPSQYQAASKKRISARFPRTFKKGITETVTLLSYPDETNALRQIAAQEIVRTKGVSIQEADYRAKLLSTKQLSEMIRELVWEMGQHDVPPDSFKQIHYTFAMHISEANWHQLLRHNRKTAFTYGPPSPFGPITIPPRIAVAGLSSLLFELADRAAQFYEKLPEHIRDYVVLNAHTRQIVASCSLWELYHLINLRTSNEAQWDIRECFTELYERIEAVNPELIQAAKRR